MITGSNGSGKSASNILAGLYETDGKILFNDIQLSNFSSESIKKVIGEYLNNQTLLMVQFMKI